MIRVLFLSSLLACFDKGSSSDDDDDGGGDDTGDWGGWGDGGSGDGGSGDGGSGDGGSGDGGSGDGGSGDGGSGDGGSGDGGSGDGGSGDGGGGGGACPDHAGFGSEGTVRRYETTASYEASSGYSGWYTMTTTRIRSNGEVELAYRDAWNYGGGVTASGNGTYTYVCDDDGVHLVSYESEGSYTSSSYSYTWWTDTTYTNPYMVLPDGVAAGDSWSDSWVYEADGGSSTGDPWSQSISGTTNYSAASSSAVTVPAGTFDVLAITANSVISGSSSSSTYKSNAEVGMVRSDYYELVSVD